MRLVTYREFSRLAKKRGWTVEMLAELFKGKIGVDDRGDNFHESLKNYFERILTCRWLNPETRRTEDRSNVVIAYRSVIEFYERELHAAGETERTTSPLSARPCPCGCGRNVYGKKTYATSGCKQRAYRERERYGEETVTDPVFEG